MDRRGFLRVAGVLGGGATLAGLGGTTPAVFAAGCTPPAQTGAGPYGALRPADALGIQLPAGFTARVIARAGETLPGGFEWRIFPDGAAVFPTRDGWIYVVNSEVPAIGGVSAIRFHDDGSIHDAYSILSGTTLNCSGGRFGRTWLSCEEYPAGLVWQCDPFGNAPAVARPAMGRFQHEAVAAVRLRNAIYMTEDAIDGRFYRFRPRVWGDLSAGTLEVMEARPDGSVVWHRVPNPTPDVDRGATPTRYQVPQSTAFAGGEGVCLNNAKVFFTTKYDNRVWEYWPGRERLCVRYDRAIDAAHTLDGVDAIAPSPWGDMYVCEDPGEWPHMEIVMITPGGVVAPFLRVHGQQGSELTGVTFSPSGDRMYFGSQRGGGLGITYEVQGPFRVP